MVTEGTRSNLFIVRDGHLITPKDEILEGITRGVVLQLSDGLLDVTQQPIPYDTLSQADEAFMTSTTKEILPVVKVDNFTIGDGRPGPITLELMERFRAYVDVMVRAPA